MAEPDPEVIAKIEAVCKKDPRPRMKLIERSAEHLLSAYRLSLRIEAGESVESEISPGLLFTAIVYDPTVTLDDGSDDEIVRARHRLIELAHRLDRSDEGALEEARADLRRACFPPRPTKVPTDLDLIGVADEFDGYGLLGMSELSRIRHRIWDVFSRIGKFDCDVRELRAALYLECRSARHSGHGPLLDSPMYDMYRELWSRWDEVGYAQPWINSEFWHLSGAPWLTFTFNAPVVEALIDRHFGSLDETSTPAEP